jgi:nuclear transport factor 2 (NTF2) superfamily protein
MTTALQTGSDASGTTTAAIGFERYAADRRFHWPAGPRPIDHPGLTELGL